ncbi:phosphopentomutase [Faecalicatena orotica]|uniref:Phosphopentomutase n=1 Tax=Faecalicatena orotica TaxID=1544 RepID=A0A2Y9BPI5_9FIRM|nr:phosphopentomutase [Faecalicatena orotica]PWJ21444.1 phosphopentomutase [Faecalicatena orotica]SSA58419.1 phosphopentomutase [Faecalicatena orotica]
MERRVCLIVLDSFGVGALPDAANYGDEGANTLKSIGAGVENFSLPHLNRLGLLKILPGYCGEDKEKVIGSYGKAREKSAGKDTTVGHWEIAGYVKEEPFPVFPEGFPAEVIERFEKATGKKVIGNIPASGTEIIRTLGKEQTETGSLIVYTSADSVFQIAANEEVIPVEELYRFCRIAREQLTGKYGVARVIARPFVSTEEGYVRTKNRHDFSMIPPKETMLNRISASGREVAAVGKIYDIFAGSGITRHVYTGCNEEGVEKTLQMMQEVNEGLIFTNLVDFDMIYGHRRDIEGYAKALRDFDARIPEIMDAMMEEDLLIITADHGCDPGYKGTDHTREYIPIMMYSKSMEKENNIGEKESFTWISEVVENWLGIKRIGGN